jgi:hypothetical protein
MVVLRGLGVLLCLVGVVWLGQGVGLIGGSFMTGEAIWAVIGVIVILVGGAMIRGSLRRTG